MFVCEMQCESVGKTQGRSQYSRLDGMLKHVLARYGDNEKDMPYNPEGTETEARPQCLENLIPFLFFCFVLMNPAPYFSIPSFSFGTDF